MALASGVLDAPVVPKTSQIGWVEKEEEEEAEEVLDGRDELLEGEKAKAVANPWANSRKRN